MMMCIGSGPRSARHAAIRPGGREAGPALENLRPLRSALCLAQKVGPGLGKGEVL